MTSEHGTLVPTVANHLGKLRIGRTLHTFHLVEHARTAARTEGDKKIRSISLMIQPDG